MTISGQSPYTRLETDNGDSIASFQRLVTADGSPTLKLAADGEAMHAMDGAFTETQYIYQPTVEKAFQTVESPSFISVGLGLGYNEILIVAESIKYGKMPCFIQSYELIPELRKAFANWILDALPTDPVNFTTLYSIYNEIIILFAEKYALPASAILFRLQDLLNSGRLVLDGAIDASTIPPRANAICFDAFSSKTSPELWTEEFLTEFFKNATADVCYVSTYACTGTLKRALKANGYRVELQKGFGSKRESTSATRI